MSQTCATASRSSLTGNTPDGGVVSGNKFTAYRTGIYFNYTQNEAANWEFLGNQIEGIAYPSGLDPDRFNAIRVETFSAGQVEFSHNQVLLGATNAREQYQYYESNVTDGTSIATPNWWGSILGPIPTKYVGTAAFDPGAAMQNARLPFRLQNQRIAASTSKMASCL